ncbi:hypothetical protein AB1Y20_017581 [Prymnesium parvum]|uniref:DUF6817 domain-containing protein n=1 Tax=Prymnesium parvum TaxID=97485 RepID=A0AB34JNL3_PRYPA
MNPRLPPHVRSLSALRPKSIASPRRAARLSLRALCTAAPPVDGIPAPQWRVAKAIMRHDHAALDASLPALLSLLDRRGAGECWHKHGTFKEHLHECHNVLRLWLQPDALCRLGLFHSAYSNSYVNLAIFDPGEDRSTVREAIGEEAEALVHKLCVVPRHQIVWDELAERGVIPPEGMQTRHIRSGDAVSLSAAELRHLLVFTMADIAEQYAGWYDDVFDYPARGAIFAPGASLTAAGHRPAALWPGGCKPGLWVSHVSRLGRAVASHPHADGCPLPPVFARCSRVITPEEELEARDAYCRVVSDGEPSDENVRTLRHAAALNPFVGEPRTVLAQCLLARGDFDAAAAEAAEAMRLHCAWGTSWDKRMRWGGWIAWTRVLHNKATERSPWPESAWGAVNLGLVR